MRVLIASLLMVLACSCGKETHKLPEKRALKLSIGNEMRSLDPRVVGEYPGSHVIRMLFDGLMRPNEEGIPIPSIAEKYVVSEDFKTYTFTLRETFWSDGEPLTAYDFEYAWRKSLDPKTLSHGAQNFYMIKNAKASAQGKLPVDEVGIKALDHKTFQVELEFPAPYFLDIITVTTFHPIPKHLDEKDPNWPYRTDGTFVSNGPFKLKKWELGNEIIVEKNPNYWDAKNVHLPEIHIDFVSDEMNALYSFEKKSLDWVGASVNRIPVEAMKTMVKSPAFNSVESPYVYWFFLNSEIFPFNNKKIRKAFSYAIDRKVIVDHIFEGEALSAQGIVAPCFNLQNTPCFQDGNFEKAKELFEEALEELELTRETFPSVVLRYVITNEIYGRVAQVVQQFWEETFGIQVELQQADWPCHFSAIQKGDYQVGMMGWISFVNDPIYMLHTFKYKNDMVNMSNWESQEYLDLLEQSNLETDPKKRGQLLIAAEKYLMEEMPVIPLCFIRLEFLKTPELVGVNLPPSGAIDFKYARFCQ